MSAGTQDIDKKEQVSYSLTVFLFIFVTLSVFFIVVLTVPNFIFLPVC